MSEHMPSNGAISRRKLLASIGLTGVALASGNAFLRQEGAFAGPVTGDVYGAKSHPVFATETAAVCNVRDFGAAGDGTRDDTASLQAALNQTQQGGISRVVVPKGTYKVTNTLRIYRNTHLMLDPGATILRCHDHSFLVGGDNGATYEGYEGHGNIVIEGGVWEGNILAYPDAFNGFGLARGQNIVVRGVEMRDIVSNHGIDMNACRNVWIENCRFLGYKDGTADQSRDYPEAIQLANHTASGFSQWGAFDGTPCRNVVVAGCYFGASGTPGTQPWPSGVGNHYAVYDSFNSNIKIAGNTFDGMTFAGVRSFKFAELFIEGNAFLNCRRGVMLSNPAGNTESSKDGAGNQTGLPQSSRNVVIAGNVFKGTLGENVYCVGWPKDNDVYAKVESVVIANNAFEQGATTSSCITARWTNRLTIAGNSFHRTYRGVWLSYVSHANIADNHFEDTKTEAVYSEEPDAAYRGRGHTAFIQIHHNQIRRCGRNGIFIQSMDGFQVSGNTIDSPALETDNARHGINVANGAKNGTVSGNRIAKAPSGNQNQYGINVTSTCANVQLSNNYAEGKTAAVLVQGATNFDGVYMHAPNGARYKMTIGSDGVPAFAPA
ncbi:right-handed parallel beta-helix repeat-containing protein [Paenibacillus sp. GYB003]|uniref:right-handed parallel beta-helix repeat-containing protein n=1 Tax=Paenibacillus sp. GYB003 TaxID=2994392 RepID=UPI002F96CFB9